MKTCIYFRDLGCQGATEILQNSLESANSDDLQVFECSKDIFILVDNLSETSSLSPLSFWKEIAKTLNVNCIISDNIDEITSNNIIITDKEHRLLLEEKEFENICIEEVQLPDYTLKTAISSFSTFVYTALRTNKDYHELSIAYMGDGGAKQISTTNNLLNAGICLKNILSFAFSEYSARQEETAFDQPVLDFAMSAGAKVFLTYSPEFIEEDSCDLLFIAPWTHQPTKSSMDLSAMKHPFCYEQIGNLFLDKTQIVSFIDQVKCSEINLDLYKKAAITSRIATLKYMLTV